MPPNQQYQDPNQRPQQQQQQYSPPQYDSDYNYILNQQLPPEKKSHKKAIILVFVMLLALGSLGAALYASSQQQNNANTPAANTANDPEKVTGTNEWTGKANNYKWSDAKNWSKGKPQSGQSLHIDASKVKQPTNANGDHTSVLFDNDVKNLSLNKIVIDGKVDTIDLVINGNGLTVTGGIEATITPKDSTVTTNIPQVGFYNPVTIGGDVTIKTTGKNLLTFYNDTDTAINLKKSLKITASATSQVNVYGAIAGAGKITIADNAIAKGAMVSFRYASPDFKGKLSVGTGNLVLIGNTNTTGSVNALGSSSVEIADGGALKLIATHTTNFIMNNNITMAGFGVIPALGNTGERTGAINACLTSAEQGCEGHVTVTLGGKVTITGDTQLGASYGGEDALLPTDTTVTYILKNEIIGGYQLAAIPASLVVIQQD
jgi:hypothetical protein